jgi:hypothetical protein
MLKITPMRLKVMKNTFSATIIAVHPFLSRFTATYTAPTASSIFCTAIALICVY